MTIEERIDRLERTNRRYRLMFTLIGVLALCAVGISATQDDGVPDVIRAKVFEVVDDEGNGLVTIGDVLGSGVFALYDKTGDTLVVIGGTTVIGKPAGHVSIFREGKMLVLLSANLGVDGGGVRTYGTVSTFNDQAKTIVQLGAKTSGGHGKVRTFNDEGQTVVEIGATVDGEGSVRTLNGKGEPLVLLGASTDGKGLVTVFGHNGKGRTLEPGP